MAMSGGRPSAAVTSSREGDQHCHTSEADQYLAAIVDNSDDAIVSMDLGGKILSWNDAATRLYGYSAAAALNQSIDLVIPEKSEQREEVDIRAQIARGERIRHYETVRRRKDGSLIEVSL